MRKLTDQFFLLSTAERARRHQLLSRHAGGEPRLAWRLAQLRPGLAIDLHEMDSLSENARQLAAWCGELFLLPPLERSARKLTLLSETQHASWSVAATELRRRRAAVAGLAPDLIDELADAAELRHARAKGLSRLTRAAGKVSKKQQSKKERPVHYLIWFGIMVIFKLAMSSSSSSPPKGNYMPSGRVPVLIPSPPAQPRGPSVVPSAQSRVNDKFGTGSQFPQPIPTYETSNQEPRTAPVDRARKSLEQRAEREYERRVRRQQAQLDRIDRHSNRHVRPLPPRESDEVQP